MKLVPSSPCYCLMRWVHEKEGLASGLVAATLLCLVRPENAPLRSKMLHASSMRPFLGALAERGIEVAKGIEIEPDELTHKELYSQLYVYE